MKITKLKIDMAAEQESKDYNKAVKVIGGHKSQITRVSGKLLAVIEAGQIADCDVAAARAAKGMVEKQIEKIEAQIDDLPGQ